MEMIFQISVLFIERLAEKIIIQNYCSTKLKMHDA